MPMPFNEPMSLHGPAFFTEHWPPLRPNPNVYIPASELVHVFCIFKLKLLVPSHVPGDALGRTVVKRSAADVKADASTAGKAVFPGTLAQLNLQKRAVGVMPDVGKIRYVIDAI